MGCGAAALGAGLILFHWAYGFALLPLLSSPRHVSLANTVFAASHLWWAVLPLAVLILSRGPWKGFCLSYAGSALVLGLIFSAGDGVDANAFFDLAAACAIALGLELERRPLYAALCLLPLPLFLAFNFHDNNFFFTRNFAAQSARDIAFLNPSRGRPCAINCHFVCGRARVPKSMSSISVSRSRAAHRTARPWRR